MGLRALMSETLMRKLTMINAISLDRSFGAISAVVPQVGLWFSNEIDVDCISW